ncbi:hypothetical protein VE03_05555 [Pseudogymnoascus sp. 23342-1-I1]|nr:hypothetical protein VE03_05555 [Pseudogymnoascus sp. 23342-1-I1]
MNDPSLRQQISPHRESKPRRYKKKCNLNLLPAEVILQITSYLSIYAHLSLRLVSRRYYVLSSHTPLITQLWFSPYLEDRKTFLGVCDHPFLGSHVTALTYDITRFGKFTFEELREFWPRPWRKSREPYTREQKENGWLVNHPGLWQYLEVVREAESSGFDEGRALAEGLRKLPSVKTVRLAFAFQREWMVSREERMSPLRMYSDVEWVSRQQNKHWDPMVNGEQLGVLLDAIAKSGARIEELELWQDYITVPLSAFKFEERFDELAILFSRLTKLTIAISKASLENEKDTTAFRKLLSLATKLRQLQLCINPRVSRNSLQELVDDSTLARMRMMERTWQPLVLMSTGQSVLPYQQENPGTLWVFEHPDLYVATASKTYIRIGGGLEFQITK